MATPIVKVAKGGVPVTEAANKLGMPVTVATNGLGLAVTVAAKGGIPVVGSGGGTPTYPYKPISNHTRIPNEGGGGASAQVMVQSRHIFMEEMNNSVFRVGWPNYKAVGAGTGEVIPASALTGRASIHYYDRSGLYQIKRLVGLRSGTGTETGAPGEYADFAEIVSGLQGSPYLLRFWGIFPEDMFFAPSQADYANGDIFRYGATTADLTGTDTAFTDTWQGARHMYLPAYIEGIATRPTLGINEDSRGVGISDTPNNDYGLSGQFDRKFGTRMATVNVSVPGETLTDFKNTAKSGRRIALLKRADFHAMGLGTNDTIFLSAPQAQITADAQAVVGLVGKPAIVKTIDPAANGATLQRPARESIRLGYSDAMAAVPAWALAAYDPRSVLENARTGQWGSESNHGGDGVHESNTGNQLAADNAPFDFSKVGSPAVVAIVKPTTLDPAFKSNNVTLSAGNLAATGVQTTSPWPIVRAIRGASTGKKFFSVKNAAGGTSGEWGIISANFPDPNAGDNRITGNVHGVGQAQSGTVVRNNAGAQFYPAIGNNGVADFAVDLDAGLVWVRPNGGVWNNSAGNNPATGVGGLSFVTTPGLMWWPACGAYGGPFTFNFGAAAYTYAPPAGFGNWV